MFNSNPTPRRASPRRDTAPLLSVQETAEHLQLSVKTIRRKIAAGELPAHRLGRLLRVSEDDLRLFKLQRRVGSL